MAEDHGGEGSLGAAEGALPLDRAFSQARWAMMMVRDGMERMERLEMGGQQPSSTRSPSYRGIGGGQDARGQQAPAAPDLLEHLRKEIGQLQVASADMNRMLRDQVLPEVHRGLWKRRIEHIAEELESFKAGLDHYLLRQHRLQVEAQERAEIFCRIRGDGAHILQGVAVLTNNTVQQDRLKSAERKAYDVLNTVGLGIRTMCLIGRLLKVDPWIAYCGMVFIIIVLIV